MRKTKTIASKNTFFIFSLNHQFSCWFTKSPLKVPWRSRMFGPLEDLQGTLLASWELIDITNRRFALISCHFL